MASLGPWLGGGGVGGGGVWDPGFRGGVWDPWDYGGGRRGRDVSGEISAFSHARVDWRETERSHIFSVDLPGVRKEDLKVQVEDDNVLQISGERVSEMEEDQDFWHRMERHRGTFLRRFRLPEDAQVQDIRCALEHGVLTVEVPKKEQQQRNVRYLEIA